jgi:hypothetical protein
VSVRKEEPLVELPREYQRPQHESCGGYLIGLGLATGQRVRAPLALCRHCQAQVSLSGEALRQLRKADAYHAQMRRIDYLSDWFDDWYYPLYASIEDDWEKYQEDEFER